MGRPSDFQKAVEDYTLGKWLDLLRSEGVQGSKHRLEYIGVGMTAKVLEALYERGDRGIARDLTEFLWTR